MNEVIEMARRAHERLLADYPLKPRRKTMAASINDIRRWFQEGIATGATHLIVVCDTYDYEDYPIYVYPEQDVRKIAANYELRAGNMQRVMEVYNLAMNMEEQLDPAVVVFNY